MRPALLLVALCALPTTASAQAGLFMDSSRVALTLGGGRFDYDLSATGRSFMLAARIERPLTRYAIAEGGLLFARPTDPNGNESTFLVPELQVQFQWPLVVVSPYVGFGGGIAWEPGRERPISVQNGGRTTDPTFSLSSGVRTWITSAVGFRFEVRRRWIGGEFTGSSTEWSVGLAVRDPR